MGEIPGAIENFEYRMYKDWNEVTISINNGTLSQGSTFLLPEGASGSPDQRVEHRGCMGGSNLTQWQVKIDDP